MSAKPRKKVQRPRSHIVTAEGIKRGPLKISLGKGLEHLSKELNISILDKPQTVMEEAKGIIYGDREKTYGHPSKNLTAIATMWSTYLTSRYGEPKIEVDAHDVCMMMGLLKIAREANHRTRDNAVDLIGYAALTDRIRE
jgi:hypothetical protein